MSDSVIYEVRDKVCTITLNEPENMNALSASLKEQLKKALDEAEADPGVNVIVLTGNGKAFCAGGDLKAMENRTLVDSVETINETTKIIQKITDSKKPIIAAVNGYAMGAGFSLALACDIVMADKKAKFGLSFAKVGLIPDLGLLYFLPKILGVWKAKELIYSAKILSSDEALELKLINRIANENELLDEAMQLADEIALGPSKAIWFVKSIFNKVHNKDLSLTMQLENFAQSILQQTEDHKEGINAFKEKRTPEFTGR